MSKMTQPYARKKKFNQCSLESSCASLNLFQNCRRDNFVLRNRIRYCLAPPASINFKAKKLFSSIEIEASLYQIQIRFFPTGNWQLADTILMMVDQVLEYLQAGMHLTWDPFACLTLKQVQRVNLLVWPKGKLLFGTVWQRGHWEVTAYMCMHQEQFSVHSFSRLTGIDSDVATCSLQHLQMFLNNSPGSPVFLTWSANSFLLWLLCTLSMTPLSHKSSLDSFCLPRLSLIHTSQNHPNSSVGQILSFKRSSKGKKTSSFLQPELY